MIQIIEEALKRQKPNGRTKTAPKLVGPANGESEIEETQPKRKNDLEEESEPRKETNRKKNANRKKKLNQKKKRTGEESKPDEEKPSRRTNRMGKQTDTEKPTGGMRKNRRLFLSAKEVDANRNHSIFDLANRDSVKA